MTVFFAFFTSFVNLLKIYKVKPINKIYSIVKEYLINIIHGSGAFYTNYIII
jgi:hypothetical protein